MTIKNEANPWVEDINDQREAAGLPPLLAIY